MPSKREAKSLNNECHVLITNTWQNWKESKNKSRTQIETQLLHVIYQTGHNWIKNKLHRLKSTKEPNELNKILRQHIEHKIICEKDEEHLRNSRSRMKTTRRWKESDLDGWSPTGMELENDHATWWWSSKMSEEGRHLKLSKSSQDETMVRRSKSLKMLSPNE